MSSESDVVGTDPPRHEANRRIAVFLLVIAIVVVIVDIVAYKQEPPAVFDAPPNWTLVGLIGGAGGLGLLAGLVLLEWKRVGSFLLTGCFVFVMMSMTTVVALWSIVTDSVPVPPAVLQHAPDPAETRQARAVLLAAAATWTCVVISHDSPGFLPTPFQRCAISSSSQVFFIVDWNGEHSYGFLFSLRATEPYDPDTCVRHLGGHWWADMWEGDPSQPCAPSFNAEGAN